MSSSSPSFQFMRLGHQCPFSHWFRHECAQLASLLGADLQDVDLTGCPDLASAYGAYSSAQLVAPDMPPLAAPRPHTSILETLARPLPTETCGRRAPPAASPQGRVAAYGPGDGSRWRDAVEQTVRLCLGRSAATAYQGEAVDTKVAWLEGLASGASAPLVFIAGDPCCPAAFTEMIPVAAAHVPLPYHGPGDLFLTCVAGRSGEHDARPWLLTGALRWLSERCADLPNPLAVWAVSGRNAPYPNGPSWLFADAGFEEVASLGKILPGRAWDDMILVRWQPENVRRAPLGLLLRPDDNVATLPQGCLSNDTVVVSGGHSQLSIVALSTIPAGHKIAVQNIATGGSVCKYGEAIGTAKTAILAGDHVHVHNMLSARAGGGSR